MNAAQKADGKPLRDHLEKLYRQTGEMPVLLEPVEVNEVILYLWEWFCDLSRGRNYTEFAPLHLPYVEIKAWAELNKIDPMAWEIQVIRKIDDIYIIEAIKK